MSYSTGEINLYSKFDFNLLFKTGWLNRRVESWEYVGDAQWRVRLSLDIDKNEVDSYYGEYYRRIVLLRAPYRREAAIPRIINIPILNVRKSAQFVDFSVSDKNGRPLKLLLREAGCHVAFTQLEGAILTLHGDQASAYGEQKLPPLSQKPELSKFLVSLFKEPLPPTGEDGKVIEFGEPGTYKQVKDYIEKSIEALSKDPEWQESSINSLQKDFEEYWKHSRVFRYLVSLNVLRWLACVRVDLDKDDFSMVKMSFLTVRNIVEEVKKSPFKRSHGLGKVSLDIDLDGVGVGEVCHVLIHAPSGTQFIPSKLKKLEEPKERDDIGIIARILQSEPVSEIRTFFGGLLKRKTPKHKFFIMKSLLERNENESEFSPEANAFGSLTPACATVKIQMGWSSNPIGDDEESKGDHLYRKIPVHDSHASVYRMCLNLAPKLGARYGGYLAYFIFSVLVVLAIFFEHPSKASSNELSVSMLLLMLASIVAAVLMGSKEEPFVNRQMFKTPSVLFKICTVVNVSILLTMMTHGDGMPDLDVLLAEMPDLDVLLAEMPSLGVLLAGMLSLINLLLAGMLSLINLLLAEMRDLNILRSLLLAAGLNFLILTVYGFWYFWCWHRSKWTSTPDSFNVSEIPVHPDLNGASMTESR